MCNIIILFNENEKQVETCLKGAADLCVATKVGERGAQAAMIYDRRGICAFCK